MAGNERSSVKSFFHRDVEDSRIWFDMSAFGEILSIDGHKVLGIMTHPRNSDYRMAGESQGYSRGDMTLYVKCSDVSNVTAGQEVNIEGVTFTVKSHSVIGHEVRRIELGAVDP